MRFRRRTSLTVLLIVLALTTAGGCYMSRSMNVVDLDVGSEDPAPEPPPEIDADPVFEPEPDHHEVPVEPAIEDPVEEVPTEDVAEEDLAEEEMPPAVLLWTEDFSDTPTRWQYLNGSWSSTGGEYVQSSSSSFAESWVPSESWNDVAVEVSVLADGVDTAAPRATAGLLLRVQEIERNYYYLCGIDFNGSKLVLVRYDQDIPPGYEGLCEIPVSDPGLSLGSWYELQGIVTLDLLVCRLVVDGIPVAQVDARDDRYLTGSIGLIANRAAARFDDIDVWSREPDDWNPAPAALSCGP